MQDVNEKNIFIKKTPIFPVITDRTHRYFYISHSNKKKRGIFILTFKSLDQQKPLSSLQFFSLAPASPQMESALLQH